MAFLQIQDPLKEHTEQATTRRFVCGIDLGTTNSLIATREENGAVRFFNEQATQSPLFPSVVHFAQDGTVAVGSAAIRHAHTDSHNTIASVKRLIGRRLKDVEKSASVYRLSEQIEGDSTLLSVETRHGAVNPTYISAHIVRTLKECAEQAVDAPLIGAVITVPAYFDDAQRQATRDAARIAGIEVLRLLNEPTAAAVAYGLDALKEGTFFVYDLGGGTFDVSVLRLARGVFQVLATGGDSALGGDDFDRAIADDIIAKHYAGLSLAANDMRSILSCAKTIKHGLSKKATVESFVEALHKKVSYTITRTAFTALTASFAERTRAVCMQVLQDAGCAPSEIDAVLCVGGATRMPQIPTLLQAIFGKTPRTDIDPDTVVARGAAIQADVLAGNGRDSITLLDVTPLSLGVEMMGGLVEKIIPRNTPIPVQRKQTMTTHTRGQTRMRIHVLQGERDTVADCRSLARFVLTDIPPVAAGAARIDVLFALDADGLLTVSATEQTTGASQRIEVKPSYGLSSEAVAKMITESMTHAQTDMHTRALIERRVQATQCIDTLKTAMREDRALLTDAAYAELCACIHIVEKAMDDENTGAIDAALEAVEAAAAPFAEARMNHAMKAALGGKHIQTVREAVGS